MIKFELLLIIAVLCSGEMVQVAESFTGNKFSDPDGWTTIQAPPKVTECSGTRLFGGHKIFGRGAVALKHFSLPPHSVLALTMQMWKIDSWDNEHFFVWVDDQLVWTKQFKATDGGQQKCGAGGNWYEQVVLIKVEMKHTGASAIVVLTSTLDEGPDNESWAIRDFKLYAELCPQNCSACSSGEGQDVCLQWSAVASSWSAQTKIGTEGWSFQAENPLTTLCGGIPLLGGFQSSGGKAAIAKKFQLPGHSKLKIKFLFAKIDSWDNEKALLILDKKVVWERSFQPEEGYFNKICGYPNFEWKNLFVRVEIEVPHTGSELEVVITSTLDESSKNESFGVRDFFLFVASCAANCQECSGPTDADCKICSKEYQLNDGKCQPLASFTLLEQSFLENEFKELDGWSLKNNKGGATIGKCGDVNMVGGFNIFGAGASAEKQFTIPSHKKLRLQMTIFKIDSWDDEWMMIKVDGQDIYKQQWNSQSGKGINFCGKGWTDASFAVDEIFDHVAPEAHIQLSSTLNQDAQDESWGFRDFKLFYEASQSCAILYSECDFKGESFQLCDKTSSDKNMPFQIRSIRIPPQGRLTAYESQDYDGKKTVYTEDQPCINYEFSQLIQMSGEMESEWKQISENIIAQ